MIARQEERAKLKEKVNTIKEELKANNIKVMTATIFGSRLGGVGSGVGRTLVSFVLGFQIGVKLSSG